MAWNKAFARRDTLRAASPDEKARMEEAAEGFQWDEALDIVQRAEDSFNRGDVEAILNRYADDVVI